MAAAAEDSKEGLRVPTGDAEPNSTSEQGELMRLNIQERQSGCPLYDRVWKWKEDQKSPSQASQIVSFFFQFAREIDKGAIGRVVFAKTDVTPKYGNKVGFGYGTGQRVQRRRRSAMNSDSIEMYALESENVLAALFVNSAFGKAKADEFLAVLLKRFSDQFKDTLVKLKPRFADAAKNPEQANLDLSFMPHFSEFDKVVEKLQS